MEARILKPVLAVYTLLFILFLYGPFFVLAILSFQQGRRAGRSSPSSNGRPTGTATSSASCRRHASRRCRWARRSSGR